MKSFESLFGDNKISGSDEQQVAEEFVSEMTRANLDPERCQKLGSDVLTIVTNKLQILSDAELLRYAQRGRGADFVALKLLYNASADDFLRLHVYPRNTSDGGYHRHSRTIVSNLQSGSIINHKATAEICDPDKGNPELEVWDCKLIDDRCTPAKNHSIGARLAEKGSDNMVSGGVYQVPTDEYHTITVEPNTATLCLFTRAGMCGEEIIDGRLIKPSSSPLEKILPLDLHAIREIRETIQ